MPINNPSPREILNSEQWRICQKIRQQWLPSLSPSKDVRAEKVPRQHRRTPWAPLTERLPTRLSAVDCQPRTITWINARIVTAQASPEADSGAANTKIALLTHPEHPPALCHFQHTSACVIPSITSREQIFLPNDDTGKKTRSGRAWGHTHTRTLYTARQLKEASSPSPLRWHSPAAGTPAALIGGSCRRRSGGWWTSKPPLWLCMRNSPSISRRVSHREWQPEEEA